MLLPLYAYKIICAKAARLWHQNIGEIDYLITLPLSYYNLVLKVEKMLLDPKLLRHKITPTGPNIIKLISGNLQNEIIS